MEKDSESGACAAEPVPSRYQERSIYHNSCNSSYKATAAILLISDRPRQGTAPHLTLEQVQEGFEILKTAGNINPISSEN